MLRSRRKKFVASFSLSALAILPIVLYAYEYGPDPGYTAAPGDNATGCTASGCHTDVPNSGTGSVKIVASGGTTYIPGQTQQIQVTITDSTEHKYGFELTARVDSNPKVMGAGTLAKTTPDTDVIDCKLSGYTPYTGSCPSGNTLQWITHNITGYSEALNKTPSYTYTFNWTPPATNVGTVTLYAAGTAGSGALVVNLTRSYQTKLQLSPSGAGTPSSIILTPSPAPSTFGQGVTLTAAVSPSSATGVVTFYDGVTILGSAPVTAGQALLTTSLLAPGARSLKAYYGGNATYSASTSTALSQTVNPVAANAFRAAVNYAVAGGPMSAAVGDFNGDGKVDLAVANNGSNNVSILLGYGDGTFHPAANFPAGASPSAVGVGDFNGDGRLDLAVSNESSNGVSVLLGNGDGTFQAPANYPAGAFPFALAVGDFNLDGKADLVIVNADGGNVSVLLGNGDGTFQPAANFFVGANPISIAVADFNGDGKPDLSVVNLNGNVGVLLGNGDGTFQPGRNYAAGSNPISIAAADFDGDGKSDLVIGTEGGIVAVLLGKGDGTFRTMVNYAAGIGARSLAAGDFNGDGWLDLAVANDSGGTVSVLYGNGDGTFQSAVSFVAGVAPQSLVVANFNGDGRADLAVANYGNNVSVFIGATLTSTTTTLSSFLNPSTYGQAVTFTATVSPSTATGTVTFYEGTSVLGTGTVASGKATLTTSLLSARVHMLTAWYAGDAVSAPGFSPVFAQTILTSLTTTTLGVSPNPSTYGQPATLTASVSSPSGGLVIPGTVAFYSGTTLLGAAPVVSGQSVFTTSSLPSGSQSLKAYYVGSANYAASASVAVAQTVKPVSTNGFLSPANYPVVNGAYSVALGDFNGDGKTDLAIASNGPAVDVLLGNGDGTFQPAVSYTVGGSLTSIAIGDFNADGKLDLAVVNGSSVFVLAGNGDGTFQAALSYGPGNGAQSVVVADFNGDGKADLAFANLAGKNVSVLLGNGDGTFQPAVNYAAGAAPQSLATGDFNGDGKVDLVVANSGSQGSMSILLGIGDGTFAAATNFGAPGISVAVADFNGDGKPDLAIVGNGAIGVSLGNGDGTFQTAVTVATMSGPVSLAAADMNGDGKIDLAVANSAVGEVGLLLGNGNGTFQSVTYSSVSSLPYSVAVGDFNGDGRADLVTGNAGGVSVLLGATLLQASPTVVSSSNPSTYGQSIMLAVVVTPQAAGGSVTFYDGTTILGTATLSNGKATITTSLLASGQRSLRVHYSGNATYAAATSPIVAQTVNAVPAKEFQSPVGFGVTGASGIAVGDFNGDGKADLAVIVSGSPGLCTPNGSCSPTVLGGVKLLLGNGDGTFQIPASFTNPGAYGFTSIAVGDFNGDGKADVAITSQAGQAGALSVLLGNGDGTLQTALNVFGTNVGSLAVADFNGDGKADLVANGGFEFLGNGDGTFRTVNTGISGFIAVGDYNNDGKPDLAVASGAGSNVSVSLGNGDGTFQPPVGYIAGNQPIAVAVGDLNGDGKADLVFANFGDQNVSVLVNNGDGTYKTAVNYAVGYPPNSVAVGDFNGDGNADLAVAGSSGVSVLLGNGDGTFQAAVNFASTGTGVLAVGDFNGDGRTDLLFNSSLLLGVNPAQLKITTQPVNGVPGMSLPAILVAVQDANGVLDTGSSAAVTVTSIPAGVTSTANAVNGVATFSGLVFGATGTYTLTATSPALTSATSNSFNIVNTYTISGQLTLNGIGLSGVTVALNGSQSSSTTTNASGSYTFSGLAAGGNYTITPTLFNFNFTPPSQTFMALGSNQVVNFVATPGSTSFTVSGQVLTYTGGSGQYYTVLSGVIINVAGSQTTKTTTNAAGNYSVTLTSGGTYTLSASLPGFSFGVPVTLSNLSANQVVNFTGGPVGLQFYPVTPCRIADTRTGSGFAVPFGPPSLAGGSFRNFPVPASSCGIPTTAAAYSLNFTAVPSGGLGFLTAWPYPQAMPNVSTLNSPTGTTVANAAIVPAGQGGEISIYASDPTDVVFDINGYFAPPLSSGLQFYPVTPCRVADTRTGSGFSGAFGAPTMAASTQRTFPVLAASCGIPATATAYSLNFTVVPHGPLGFLTTWPAGQSMPNVSTLNSPTGTVVANAAIVPTGVSGAVNVYVSNAADVVFDINGYFAPPTAPGLNFYPVTPCRVADTRSGSGFTGAFGAPTMAAATQRSFPVPTSTCQIPASAGAYSLNFTVVPQGPLGFLSTWPTGQSMPNASTLNSPTGTVVANAAIVPAGQSGAINVYVSNPADVLFDINGYFSQ